MDFDAQDTMYPSSSSSPYPRRQPITRPTLPPRDSYMSDTESLDAKVVVMGDSAVGKTSLVQRFADNDFNPSSTTTTTGAFFVTKKVFVDGLKVRLQLWDTAGQERFRSMAPMYYRGANAAILCYDITEPATFNHIQTWVQELKHHRAPPPSFDADPVGEEQEPMLIYIVGAKADLGAVSRTSSRRGPRGPNANYSNGLAITSSDGHTNTTSGGKTIITREFAKRQLHTWFPPAPRHPNATTILASPSPTPTTAHTTSSNPFSSFGTATPTRTPTKATFFQSTNSSSRGIGNGNGNGSGNLAGGSTAVTTTYARQTHLSLPGNSGPPTSPISTSSKVSLALSTTTATAGLTSPGTATSPTYIRPRFISLTSNLTAPAQPLALVVSPILPLTSASPVSACISPTGMNANGHPIGNGQRSSRTPRGAHHHRPRHTPPTSPDPSPSSIKSGITRASSARVVPVGTRVGNMPRRDTSGSGGVRRRPVRERRWSDAMMWDDAMREREHRDDGEDSSYPHSPDADSDSSGLLAGYNTDSDDVDPYADPESSSDSPYSSNNTTPVNPIGKLGLPPISSEDEFRLEKNMFLFEVSAKDGSGIDELFDHLIASLVKRSEVIRREKAERERNSVVLDVSDRGGMSPLSAGAASSRGGWGGSLIGERGSTSIRLGGVIGGRGGWSCCST